MMIPARFWSAPSDQHGKGERRWDRIDKIPGIQEQGDESTVMHADLAAAAQEELLAEGLGLAAVAIGSMASDADQDGGPFMPGARQRAFRQGQPVPLLARPCLDQLVAECTIPFVSRLSCSMITG